MFFSWSLSDSHLLSARLSTPSQTAKISHMSLRVQHRSSAWWMSFDSLSTLKGLYPNFKAIWSWNVTLLGFKRILAYRVKYFIFVYSVLRRQGLFQSLFTCSQYGKLQEFFKSILIVQVIRCSQEQFIESISFRTLYNNSLGSVVILIFKRAELQNFLCYFAY